MGGGDAGGRVGEEPGRGEEEGAGETRTWERKPAGQGGGMKVAEGGVGVERVVVGLGVRVERRVAANLTPQVTEGTLTTLL